MPKPSVTERVRVLLTNWSSVLRYAALLVLFLLAYVLLLRPVKKQVVAVFKELPSQIQSSQAQLPAGAGELDGKAALALKKQLVDKVKAEPASASRLVQAWLREGGQ